MEGDKLALATAEPDVETLIEEYRRSADVEYSDGVINTHYLNRKWLAENTRFAVWDNQTSDGKKHDTEEAQAFPWEGASDTRIRLADEIIIDNVDVLDSAFSRAQFVADGIEAQDAMLAGTLSKALEWARSGGIPGLRDEAHYSFQHSQTYGWCVAHVTWERRIAKRYQAVGMDQIVELSKQAPPNSLLSQLPLMINDPTLEEQAVEVIRGLYQLFVRSESPALLDHEVPELNTKRARKVVRELRERGTAEVPVPYLRLNNPCVVSLTPYEEVFFPPETTDLQRARVIFRVDWLTEAELDQRVLSDGWNEAWVAKVKQSAGKESTVTQAAQRVNTSGTSTQVVTNGQERRNMCEVVWAYTRGVDEDGVECVYCTVFSPHLSESFDLPEPWAKHELLNYSHGLLPFVAIRREKARRRITDSRGVPEIVFTWQQEKKAQRDGMFDRTSLSILPPLKKPERNRGKVYRLAPAAQVGVQRSDELEWMDPPPGNVNEAIELVREIGMDANNYFGRISEGVDPVKAQLKQQNMADQYLNMWVDVFKQVLALMQQFMSDEEWIQITGATAPSRSFEEIQRGRDWKLKFDVRDLNTDFMVAKLKAFTEFVLPADAAGVIDRSKFSQLTAAWIDPSIARAVVTDQSSASQQLFNRVQQDLIAMALGNEVMMAENDPTASRQLQFAEQIIKSNPKYIQALETDERFAELLKQWAKNKEFLVSQEQNKMIGRIGVKPGVEAQ